jgi:uncharacterized iron-regulated membrane protein
MQNNVRKWIVKWHIAAGIALLPFVIIIASTGAIYLFKNTYENKVYAHYYHVTSKEKKLSYQKQYEIATKKWDRIPEAIVVPESANASTVFTNGSFGHQSKIYIDPYSGQVKGIIQLNKTGMYKIRKLHGELLSGKVGSSLVELTASWLVVLLITGLILFWPKQKGWSGFFKVRINQGKHVLFRDLHGLLGFWFSFVLILILAGGLPWTEVFGHNYRWVQEKLNAGYPSTWYGDYFQSEPKSSAISIDEMMHIAKKLNLEGKVSIQIPQSSNAVFSVSNETANLKAMQMVHFDQYSGQKIFSNHWSDIGWMMRMRLWVMAFHQGELGAWNWILVFTTALGLVFLSKMALLSFLFRRKNKAWHEASLNTNSKGDYFVVTVVLLLGILLPLFGASIVLLFLLNVLRKKWNNKQITPQ